METRDRRVAVPTEIGSQVVATFTAETESSMRSPQPTTESRVALPTYPLCPAKPFRDMHGFRCRRDIAKRGLFGGQGIPIHDFRFRGFIDAQ